MGTDNLFWKRKRELKRRKDTREKKPAILIVCEGKKTEPNYFKSFRVTNLDVNIIGKGADPKSLVDYACDKKKDYDQTWCVFDRDVVPKNKFSGALDKARYKDIQVAYSNEAFELWYVLHFEYMSAAISRKQYCEKLNKLLGKKYQKNDEGIYDMLLDKQAVAIRNAKKLFKNYNPVNPINDNPSTTVHKLVEELNEYVK